VLDVLVVHFLLVRCGAHVAPPIDESGRLHTASTAPTFSSGNRALPRPFVWVGLPRALPSVSRTHAIVRTVGTARSSAHSNTLSQSRTRRLRVRECDRSFASSGVFGIAWAGSCLPQILPLAWSTWQNRCHRRGILASRQILALPLPLPRRGGDATTGKMRTLPANSAFWRFGVARWRCSYNRLKLVSKNWCPSLPTARVFPPRKMSIVPKTHGGKSPRFS
jgi:hypothetical protein